MSSPLKPEPERTLDYHPGAGCHDEVVDAAGAVRPPWRYLVDSLAGLGHAELAERRKKAMRILRDDGATYNIYSAAQMDRTWPLDPVPWVIDSEEWSLIEAGLLERAELFNFILQDIYGPRELIKRHILPPEALFGHKGFLRPCDGIRLPGEHQLVVYAADMVRRPDGTMCVLTDRAQAPSGACYALENRTVMSRVFPSLFRDSHVHRLALFFQNLRQKLMDLAPGVASPRIVVLTPGPYNETYFEHAYLANYLGFSLVQSGDLEVRNGCVCMKSLDGLKRVDVILRRVDDIFCDPVELKSDSQLGIPGLLQVVRDGRVAVANPLGSGVLENPVLLRYLPAISNHFLGRQLRLNSVATWWCGDDGDFAHVVSNLDRMVVKPVFRTAEDQTAVVSELDDRQRQALLARIRANPAGFVAQECVLPSHLPAFGDQGLSPRPAVLRAYGVASEASYRLMPGGLTRIGTREGGVVVSNQAGSVSKDTWVLASEPEKQVSLWPRRSGEGAPASEPSALPSRVVENLFWMGRYAERAESGLRLMRTVFLQTGGINPIPDSARRLLLQAVTQLTATYPGFVRGGEAMLADPDEELLAVILDRKRAGSVRSCIVSMLGCAEESRELLSSDTQRIINDIRDQMAGLEHSLRTEMASAPEEALAPLVSSLLALSGLIHESMTRGLGWRFMDMGRRLERAMQTITLSRAILVSRLPESEENVLLESLLMTVEALISYRRRHRAGLDLESVLELTLIDSANPRSILFQLEQLQVHIECLPRELSMSRELAGEKRTILEAVSLVKLSVLAELAGTGSGEAIRTALDQLFSRLYHLLGETSSAIGKRYFAHAAGPRQLLSPQWQVD